MKTLELRVGAKGERAAVKVPVQIAETLDEATSLARGSSGVFLRCFNRGWRIENQERSGARDAFVEGQTTEQIAALVAAYDPTKVLPRTGGGRRAKPVEVRVSAKKKSFSVEEMRELLAAAGAKVNIVVAEGATA